MYLTKNTPSRYCFSFIEEEDLLRFMIKEEVDLLFPMFDGAAETGKSLEKLSQNGW